MTDDIVLILKDFLHGKPSQVEVTDELLIHAKQHEIEGIVYYQTKVPQLRQKYFYLVYVYQQRLEADKEIRRLLPYSFSVKGLHLAKFYPVPYLRTCGDLDLVVPKAKKEQAVSVLEQNGYVFSHTLSDAEWHFEKNGLDYELHHALLYDEVVNDDQYQEYFSHCWEHVRNGELDWNFHFLFVFIHFRKHFMNNGVGFRHFLDLAVLVENKEIEWDYIIGELENLGLLPFAKTCYTLIEAWFSIPSPIGTIELAEGFVEQAAGKILVNGVFGFNDESNRGIGVTNSFIQSRHSRTTTRILLTLSMVFPSYKAMRYVSYYSFVDNRPYLLPVAWIYRWCTAWKRRGRNVIGDIYNNDEKIRERTQYLESWNVKLEEINKKSFT
jgi:hypothetical protein